LDFARSSEKAGIGAAHVGLLQAELAFLVPTSRVTSDAKK
jgi:hypothetical protein